MFGTSFGTFGKFRAVGYRIWFCQESRGDWLVEVMGWPTEVRDLSNRSKGQQGQACLGPVDESEGPALPIKVRGWVMDLARAGQ